MSSLRTRSPAWPNGVWPEVVPERDRLGQLLVQPQHLGDAARDLRDLERVRQARAVVIAGRREEHLRLVLQTAERLAVDDAIAIALERRADRIVVFRPQPAARVGALRRLRREDLAFALLELLAYGHGAGARSPTGSAISRRKLVPLGRGRRRTAPRSSGRDPRTSAACRGRRRRGRRRRRGTPARTRASDRCSASSDRCRDRPSRSADRRGRAAAADPPRRASNRSRLAA